MLSKDKRLNLKKDFKWIASGKKIESKLLILFLKHGDNKYPKIGIAVSSKHFKKAFERNRARRIVSAAIEALYLKLPVKINIVALPKTGALKVKSQDVLSDLEKILRDEKIIN